MADSRTECHLLVMSQQTTTVTNQASVIHVVIHAFSSDQIFNATRQQCQIYMHGTCLDLYRAPFISR